MALMIEIMDGVELNIKKDKMSLTEFEALHSLIKPVIKFSPSNEVVVKKGKQEILGRSNLPEEEWKRRFEIFKRNGEIVSLTAKEAGTSYALVSRWKVKFKDLGWM